jgi:hypothetical protein
MQFAIIMINPGLQRVAGVGSQSPYLFSVTVDHDHLGTLFGLVRLGSILRARASGV